MLLFYIRHGDPIYNPNMLTPLGERQAEAIAKRLALYGIDEVYASPSNRAVLTSKPTCDILKKEAKLLPFADEHLAWQQLVIEDEKGKDDWVFRVKKMRNLLNSEEIRNLGNRWFDHPEFKGRDYEKGIERIYEGADEFLSSLGYEHIRYTGKYKAISPNEKRVAFFAHQGFGLSFLSCLLDIPLPMFATHFDICHTGLTVIEFPEFEGFSVPRVLVHSSDAHLYKEGLPTLYNGEHRF